MVNIQPQTGFVQHWIAAQPLAQGHFPNQLQPRLADRDDRLNLSPHASALWPRHGLMAANISAGFSQPASFQSPGSHFAASQGLGQSIGDFINEILPKPQPFSWNSLGKQMAATAIVGAISNSVKGVFNMAIGKWSGQEARKFLINETVDGVVGGAGYGLGMGLTSMALTPLGVTGIALAVAGIAVGALGSVSALTLWGGLKKKHPTPVAPNEALPLSRPQNLVRAEQIGAVSILLKR